MLSNLGDKLPAVLRGRIGLALVGLAGLSLTLVTAYALRESDMQGVRQEFERRADLRFQLLRANLREYDSALFSLRLLIENSEDLSPAEFAQAASLLAARLPGIQAVQWVPVVRSDEIKDFAATAAATAPSGFMLRERGADGAIGPIPASPSHDEHAFITYVEPVEGNEATLGYDIYTAPTAPTIRCARAMPGVPALSQAFPLVQGGRGIVFCLFVQRASQRPVAPPAGGDGFVQLVLRLDAASSRFFVFSLRPVHDTLILDVTDEEPTPIYLHHANSANPAILPTTGVAGFSSPDTLVRDLPVGGRLWRVFFRPSPAWIAERRSPAPRFTVVGGMLFTVLAMAYLDTLRRQTKRIRREVELRTAELDENRALLDEIIDHNPSSIWVKDASLRYQLVNLSFAACYNRPRTEIIGRTDAGLHPPETVREMEKLDARILASGDTVSFEASYQMPAGRRTYLVSKFPLRRAEGTIYAIAGIATDITALREAESRQLSIERKLLETQKLESLGVLAGGVAHDFNNLLTSILGHANLARLLLPPGSGAQASLLQIETASQRAAELCRQMLAYSGRGRFSVQPVELGQLVRDTAALLKLSLARRARLDFDLAPDLPPAVVDVTQIRQIVMNLVINASESLAEGCGDITLRTRLVRAAPGFFASSVLAPPESAPGDYVCLEVADTGCGMEAATVARIFDPFFTTKFTGRGLGLAAVLGIVRGHQGALSVESEPGRGTIFRIYLPSAKNVAPGAAPAVVAEPARPAPPTRGAFPRVLLVDDELAVRETAAGLLHACGFAVDACADGEAALRLFTAAPDAHHAAIIDLTMPGLGGAELLRRLREHRPRLPVLIISGYDAHDHAVLDLLSTPGVAFLAKPFTLEALRAKLDELVPRGTGA